MEETGMPSSLLGLGSACFLQCWRFKESALWDDLLSSAFEEHYHRLLAVNNDTAEVPNSLLLTESIYTDLKLFLRKSSGYYRENDSTVVQRTWRLGWGKNHIANVLFLKYGCISSVEWELQWVLPRLGHWSHEALHQRIETAYKDSHCKAFV